MALRSNFKLTLAERKSRRFSESFKREKVREMELGRTRPCEIQKQYDVAAPTVYKWINKYGTMKDKPERLIVETQSDTLELLALKKKIAELEQIVGQKQIVIDFQDKMFDIASEMFGVDIKKKLSYKQSDTTGSTERNTL